MAGRRAGARADDDEPPRVPARAAGKLVVKKRADAGAAIGTGAVEHAARRRDEPVSRATSAGSASLGAGVGEVGRRPLVELHQLVDLGRRAGRGRPRGGRQLLEPGQLAWLVVMKRSTSTAWVGHAA